MGLVKLNKNNGENSLSQLGTRPVDHNLSCPFDPVRGLLPIADKTDGPPGYD